jgi:transcriptional regulator
MHPNPVYRTRSDAANLDFARETGFGVLAVSTSDAPLVSHIPFVLTEDGSAAEFHLVRSNPIARMLATPCRARLAVQGPHGYISPDWYGIEDQVPTWNYVAVHLTGTAEALPQHDLHGLLDRLSDRFEADLAPKPVWKSTKMTPEAMERMLRQIQPFRLRIETVDGTWKLTQNKVDSARLGAADGLERSPLGAETAALAALMRNLPE